MTLEGYQYCYYAWHRYFATLEVLLEAQADPNPGSPLPLEHAVNNQILVAIPKLLEAGADPKLLPESTRHDLEQLRESAFLQLDGDTQSAASDLVEHLYSSIMHSSSSALKVLAAIVWYDPSLKMFNPLFEVEYGWTPLASAAKFQRREVVRYLLQLEQEEVDLETVKFPDSWEKWEKGECIKGRKLLREMAKERWPRSSDATQAQGSTIDTQLSPS